MENKRKTVLAGSFISQPLADLLALRSLYEDLSKSKMLGNLINEYLLSGPSVEEMCDKIAERIFTAWLYLEEYKKCPWEEYLGNEGKHLEKNGISKQHIDIILNKADQKRKEKVKVYGTD